MKEKGMKKRTARRGVFSISLMWMLLLLSFGILGNEKAALAGSAVVSLTTGDDEVKKGDIFSVMVTLESADDIGNVEMFVVFDSEKVSFVEDGKYTTGGDGLVLISDWNEGSSSTRKKYALEFKAKKEGTCRFSVGSQPAVYMADGEEQMSVSSINMEVKVVSKKTEQIEEDDTQEVGVTEKPASDKMAELQNIMLADGTLVPEFNKDITSYRVTLPNEITKLALSALPESDSAEVSINGNENLQVGENVITIVVKAENGARKEYTITVVREIELPAAEDNEELDTEPKAGVHCIETEDGQVVTSYTKLTVKELEDETQIPNGYMETSIRMDEQSVTVYMPEDNMDSETYLIYGMDSEGNTGFYEYNRVTYVLQPYQVHYGGSSTAEQSKEVVNANFQMMTAIIILILICTVLSVALALQMLKNKGKKGKEEEDFFNDYI